MVRTAAALALVLVVSSSAWAETAPTEALQQVFAKANDILTDPESADRPLERLLAVRKLVNDAFDFRSAAELASGDHWLARTTAEQEEFTWLFSDLLERGFVSRMASKASLTGGTKIRYLDESIDGDTALVQTAMARRNGGELSLDYHLVDRDGAWKIRDVAIDGVSLMANYRAQLDRVLGNASFPELLGQMRAKVGVADQPEPPAPAPVVADLSPPTDVPATEEVPPRIHIVSVADVPPPALEIRLATFEPVFAVPEAVEPPASRPPDEPMTAPAAMTTAAAATPVVATPPILVTTPAVAASLVAVTSPAVVTPPGVKPPPRTHTTRAYWLRMMTAGTAEEASRLVSRLRDGKFPIAVDRTNGRGKLMVSVRVGPFRDAEQAVLKLLDLQTKGHNPYLVAERD
jgi:phospholipid transport system substrate-binding protein